MTQPDGQPTDDVAAWTCALDVFERRIRERFLSCIEALEKADSRSDVEVQPGAPPDCSTLPNDQGKQIAVPGFAIMALCCLLIETLQSFREAPEPSPQLVGSCSYPKGPCVRPPPPTKELFRKLLRLPAFRNEFDEKTAGDFVDGIRHGIMHEAETRRWVVWRDEPPGRILEPVGRGYALNRTGFCKALTTEFENYLDQLRDPGRQDLRKRFLKKMDDIVKEI